MPTLFKAPTTNYISTTLNGSINDSVDTITLNSTTGMQYPGYVVIDREDGNQNATPNAREVVSYTGITGNQLTGCGRGADNSTARSHNDGALVETIMTAGMWNDLRDIVEGVTPDGSNLLGASATISAITHTARLVVTSIASVSRAEIKQMGLTSVASIARADLIQLSVTSVATIPMVAITTHIDASAASVTGFGGGLNLSWNVPGGLASMANVGGMLVVPSSYTAKYMVGYVQTPASIASVSAFVVKQGGTVVGMLGIVGAGTYGSSASLAVTALSVGDNLTLDIRSTASLAQDLSVILRAN